MIFKHFADNVINQNDIIYCVLILFVIITFIVDNDAFAIVYHYEPFLSADGNRALDIPNSQDLQLTSFTVATWFKTTANFPDEGVMVNKGGLGSESPGANQNYGIWFTPTEKLQGGFETTGGSNKYISSVNTYNDGQWHHGVVTFDDLGNIIKLFVDGVMIGSLTTTSTPDNTGNQPLRIAGNAQSLIEDFFIGEIDEVGIWNRPLSQTEITHLMNNGTFVSSGLVFKNSFDNSSPPPAEVCNNGIDDDGDGFIDSADAECPSPSPDMVYHYEPFLNVDSFDDAVSVPSTQSLKLTQFSVSAWFKTTSNFGSEASIVNKGGFGTDSSGNNMNYGIWFTSSERFQGGFETSSSGTNQYATSTVSFNDGQWHHGVVTFDGSIVRLYVDGIQFGTKSTFTIPETLGNNPLKIGANSRVTSNLFIGSIDEVGVWNRPLSQTEITHLMNNGTFVSSGLVFKNSFDNSSPPPAEVCNNGIDDDGDGFIDSADAECPPPSENIYPISNIIWTYDSKKTLSNAITIPDGMTHPTDPVLFSSGASGVDSHSIRNGWLEVESGGGSGRVYWDYHQLPSFSQLSTAGYNTVMTGTFMFKPGIDNLSIKDGNHPTNGWILNGQLVFGGFGISFHRSQVEAKVEYWHDLLGNGGRVSYPNSLKLIDNKEYKFFITFITDRVNQAVILNAWLDFGDGNGWVKVMTDMKWGKTGWNPGNVPNGADKADIIKGPSFIKKHHIWTRANSNGGVVLPVKDIRIGTIGFIS
jgi:hypothetical protein